jgi:FAD/FMN-containing dehydrogenase
MRPDNVASCVRFAREAGLRVAPQATGHGAAGDLDPDVLPINISRIDT